MTDEEYRAGMRASSPVPEVVLRLDPIVPPPASPRTRSTNDPFWNSLSGRHHTGGAPRPAQTYRGRYGERRPRAERVGRR
ncbi:hypothetical protein ABNF97_20950 [Plantactinospora sp. B6F1]|uniref:hypothetical protein n=1 Tax=Plantactinospora sp. B6F1 TaxID=3158971 RepID=UPI0032D8D725